MDHINLTKHKLKPIGKIYSQANVKMKCIPCKGLLIITLYIIQYYKHHSLIVLITLF